MQRFLNHNSKVEFPFILTSGKWISKWLILRYELKGENNEYFFSRTILSFHKFNQIYTSIYISRVKYSCKTGRSINSHHRIDSPSLRKLWKNRRERMVEFGGPLGKKLAYGRCEGRVIVGAMVRKRELFSLIQLGGAIKAHALVAVRQSVFISRPNFSSSLAEIKLASTRVNRAITNRFGERERERGCNSKIVFVARLILE